MLELHFLRQQRTLAGAIAICDTLEGNHPHRAARYRLYLSEINPFHLV